MLYPHNIEQKLGFDKIRELISNQCLGIGGKKFVEKMRFGHDFSLIEKTNGQTAEYIRLRQLGLDPAIGHYQDISILLSRAEIVGYFLTQENFSDLRSAMIMIDNVLVSISKQENCHLLKAICEGINLNKQLIQFINKVLDENGNIKDSASPTLLQIRKGLSSTKGKLRSVINTVMRSAQQSGYSEEGSGITIRNGRMVIPIYAEHKRKFKGFVHDESATGQTVYMEPQEVLEINNEVRELEYAESREVVRILTELTTAIRSDIGALKRSYMLLCIMDFIRAKSVFAMSINATVPVPNDTQTIKWINAVHPLLFILHQKQDKPIVPLSIQLTPENRILLVSGPNAGGKSVLLKTVGLLQYMFQCGVPVSASPDSNFGIFKNILIDIGDEQSLENDLSTYSSHLTAMKHFVLHTDKNSLILIDEFGTGTDPLYGGAIAESILENINKKNSWGVINTHYSNLKSFAEITPGISNGAMRFDTEKIEPLYQLEIGNPGSSFAIELATKIGLPSFVIERSKQKIGRKQINVDELLMTLERDKEKTVQLLKDNEQKKRTLDEMTAKYKEQNERFQNQRKDILNQAKEEAKKIVAEANKKIEEAIRQIRTGISNEEIKETRKELQNYKEKIKTEALTYSHTSNKDEDENAVEVIAGKIEIGDHVRIKGQTAIGVVSDCRTDQCEVTLGGLRTFVKLNKLEKVSKKEVKQQAKEYARNLSMDLAEKTANFSTTIDLRGKRAEEAIELIEKTFDDALLIGANELRIVHGKGDGVLRQIMKDLFTNRKGISRIENEHPDRGGEGITILYFR